jgi:hypothetical protein
LTGVGAVDEDLVIGVTVLVVVFGVTVFALVVGTETGIVRVDGSLVTLVPVEVVAVATAVSVTLALVISVLVTV